MQYWLRNSGSAQNPYTRDDWRSTHGDLWPTVNYPEKKKPTARTGDRMFWHAIGSAALLGEACIFALGEIMDHPAHWDPAPKNPRWPWALPVEILVTVPLLSMGPRLIDFGKDVRSLRRQAAIKLTDEEGRRAEALLRAAAGTP
jgi:hypothetical protein